MSAGEEVDRMTTEYSCGNCGNSLRAADGEAGRKSKCPNCGNVAAVPTAGSPLSELALAVAARAAESGPSPRAKDTTVELNWTVRIVGGMIGAAVVFMVVVSVYGHFSNQRKAEERVRLTRMIDEQVSTATAKTDVYDFDAARRALDDGEEALGRSLLSNEYVRNELSDKISVARSSLQSFQAKYRSKIGKGWLLFEGQLITSSKHQEILSERKRQEAEQAQRRAEAERRNQEDFRQYREELVRRRRAAEEARNWYEGGTLHQKSALKWQVASAHDKLATCADFVAKMWKQESFVSRIQNSIESVSDMRPLAQELVECLDAATEQLPDPDQNKRMYANQTVSSMATMCMLLAKWLE